MKKIWKILLLLLLVLGGAAYGFRWWKMRPAPLVLEPHSHEIDDSLMARVERRDLQQRILVSGEIAPLTLVDVKPEVSGRIKKICVTVGAHVKQNDVLVELDDRDLLTEKSGAETEVEGTSFTLERNKRQFERSEQLYKRKLVSLEYFENAKTDFLIAENAWQKAKSRLQTVADKLAKTRIMAPMAGTILVIPVVEWQVVVGATSVNSGSLLMTIADLSSMIIQTHINQVEISKIKEKQSIYFTVDSLPGRRFAGVVFEISPVATIRNATKGFPVKILVKEMDPSLRPGMTADVVFTVKEVKKALSIPLAAVFTDNDDTKFVYVASDNPEIEPMKKKIDIGVVTYDFAEVKSGVTEGVCVLLIPPSDKGRR